MDLLDREKTYSYFWNRYRWPREVVDEQIFTPLDMNSVWATVPDVLSIMCYQFPGECTKNGQPIPGGLVIDELDGSLMAKKYPLGDNPDHPDHPEGTGKLTIDLASKTISVGPGWTLKAVN